LEISLIQQNIDHVFSIYNSFRKEQTDATHLSEFHHIEYEGKVNQQKNEEIALGLVNKIIMDLVNFESECLHYFLSDKKIHELTSLVANPDKHIFRVTFADALDTLYHDTKNEKYKKFTMNGNFGSWEEIRLTEIYNGMVIVRQFPLLEVPFYHATVENVSPAVAENSDFIWPGYREFIGSGLRVRSQKELEEKAILFNLPHNDYLPYLQTRQFPDYQTSAGFGMGWERLMQGLLQMPFIWSASHFPRSHKTLAL
jgi:aspartyl/asparaginyl-tRNA synthetase